MECVRSYQDIKSPYDYEEENLYDEMVEEYAEEYDPEEAEGCSFSTYMSNCRSLARKRIEEIRG